MSSPDKRKQERGRKKTDSACKKLATKGQGWIAIGQWMLPSRKADKYPEKIEDVRAQDPAIGGFIHENTLHALVATTNGIEFSKFILAVERQLHIQQLHDMSTIFLQVSIYLSVQMPLTCIPRQCGAVGLLLPSPWLSGILQGRLASLQSCEMCSGYWAS